MLEQINLEHAILSHLLYDKDYAEKVLPHIKKDHFQERVDQTIFAMISGYIHKYNRPPSKEMLEIELLEVTGISDDDGEKVEHVIASLHQSDESTEWIIDKTEKWISDRRQWLTLSKLIDKDNPNRNTAITELQDAINFTFKEDDDLTSFEDFDIDYWKEANYIIKELVPSSDGDVGVISGESQVGKTFLVVNMMAHVVNGVPWAGKRAKACTCLYVAGEASKGIEKRVHGHKSAYPDMTFRNEKLGTRAYFKADRLNMANPKDQNKLKAWIKKTGAKFVVLDTLSTMLKGSDSKDEDVKPFINGMISVAKETGATIAVTHHPSKNGQSKQKGSGDVFNSMNFILNVEVVDNDDDDRCLVGVTSQKMKDEKRNLTFYFDRKITTVLDADSDGDPVTTCYMEFVPNYMKPAKSDENLLEQIAKNLIDTKSNAWKTEIRDDYINKVYNDGKGKSKRTAQDDFPKLWDKFISLPYVKYVPELDVGQKKENGKVTFNGLE
jgi:hypothetical protein